MGAAATGCGPSSAPPEEAQSASEPATTPAAPVDVVQARRPDDEAQLLKAYSAATADINAPNDIVRDQISNQRNAVWKIAVSKLGELHSWTGKIKDIHDTGWFSISINDTLEFDNSEAMVNGGDDRPNPEYQAWLLTSIKQFSPGQAVKFSGYIDPQYTEICFTIDRFDFSCGVKITSISSL